MSARVGHALLSCSGSHRWLNCTASVFEEQKYPDTTSIYAEEGSRAHELAEIILKQKLLDKVEKYPEWILNNLQDCKSSLGRNLEETILTHGNLEIKQMLDYVEVYVNHCCSIYDEFELQDLHPFVAIEQVVSLEDYYSGGFGTIDFVCIAGSVLHICDLKYGRGVEVSAIDNSQLILYALGEFIESKDIYNITTIITDIIQPRITYTPSTCTYSLDDLKQFEDTKLLPALNEIYGNQQCSPHFRCGDWCKFCKLNGFCREQKNYIFSKISSFFTNK